MRTNGERLVALKLELRPETVELLEVLRGVGPNARTVAEVVRHLVASAVAGVQRPGSWERPWLAQAFGEAWIEKLEPDPDAPAWHERPIRRERRR
ncbi:MAG TPA: hypothetical protein VFL83_21635 [Anaeromyxobacter sp.]|nr:hypothetical protein [Anaeromyxobacter sp.]